MVYPGLPSHPQAEVAQRQLRAGGGMLAFDLGRSSAAAAFIDALRIPPRTASLGSVVTFAVHPPSATHRQLDDGAAGGGGHPAGAGAHLGRASRTSRTSSPTSTSALAAVVEAGVSRLTGSWHWRRVGDRRLAAR